jgi:hypothetical protein
MVRRLLIAAAAVLFGGIAIAPLPAQAQEHWRRELRRMHRLCDQDYKPACIRFGYILGSHQMRHSEWRRENPNWWWWQPWAR